MGSVSACTSRSTASSQDWWILSPTRNSGTASKEFLFLRRGEVADVAGHGMQEADRYFQGGRAPFDQAFGLHDAWFGAILSCAVGFGINASEGKPLAVLLRGRAIRVQNVSLVKHGIDDAVHEFLIQGATSAFSMAGRSCSIALSQLARPCWRL